MRVGGFLGPSNRQSSLALDPEQSINLFAVAKQAGSPKVGLSLQARPVLRPWAKGPSGPVRGSFTLNGRAFVVCGTSFCEIKSSRVMIVHGAVALDANPATFAGNGQGGEEVLLTSGGFPYLFDLTTDTLTQVTDPSLPVSGALRCEFLASKFILQYPATNQFFYSAEYDGSSWNALDFFEPSLTADVKVSMFADHGNLWLHGGQRTEIWQPTENQNTPYAPFPSSVIEFGTAAGFSVTRVDNGIWWIQGDERGNKMVFRSNGMSGERVSTNAVEYYLRQQSLSQIQQSCGYAFQIGGHSFYAIYIPGAPFTPVYQVDTGLWFDWAHWDSVNLAWKQFRARNAIFVFDTILMGDPFSGTLYELTFDYEADAVII